MDTKGNFFPLLLFSLFVPVFMLYQSAVQFSLIPPVFGGYLTLISAIVFIPALFCVLRDDRFKGYSFSFSAILFFAFVGIVIIFISYGFLFNFNLPVVVSYAGGLLRLIALFLILLCFDVSRKKNLYILEAFYIFYSFLVIFFSDGGAFVVRGLYFDGDIFQIDYQAQAAFYLMLLIFILPCVSSIFRFIMYCISAYVFFLLGARTELVAFFVLLGTLEILMSRNIFLSFVWVVGVSSAGFFALYYLSNIYADSRVFGLFDLLNDASAVSRREFSSNALDTIALNPFFGSYASYEVGYYAHNFLSVWVDYGIIGFIVFLGIFITKINHFFRFFRKRISDVDYLRALTSLVIVIFLLLFSKHYLHIFVSVSMAFFVVSRSKIKKSLYR